MKIWWCEEHKSGAYPGSHRYCWVAVAAELLVRCRMVEMRLVSVDALVIEKVDGEWPPWSGKIIVDLISEGDAEPYLADMLSVGILDALAAAQAGGDPEVPKDPWDYDP